MIAVVMSSIHDLALTLMGAIFLPILLKPRIVIFPRFTISLFDVLQRSRSIETFLDIPHNDHFFTILQVGFGDLTVV
jgi:hypothetical protein